jgi:hypothetical protein
LSNIGREFFGLKNFGTRADGVGMRDTNRYMTHRRPPASSQRALPPQSPSGALPAHVETLRKLVAAGQYQINPRYLAMKIFRAAGVSLP